MIAPKIPRWRVEFQIGKKSAVSFVTAPDEAAARHVIAMQHRGATVYRVSPDEMFPDPIADQLFKKHERKP